MKREGLNKEKFIKEIDEAFNKVIGGVLGIAEGFFKENMSIEKWNGFRKLVLDFGNVHRRCVKAKLEGRNYYHLVPFDRKGN